MTQPESRPNRASENPDLPDVRLAPHPTLTRYYATEHERYRCISTWFDTTAPDYDWINRFLSLGTGLRYRRDALLRAGLGSGMQLLDVGCGTGVIAYHAGHIVSPHGQVTALDPSRQMLHEAQQKGVRRVAQGFAECLPFADNCFDMLSMGYALRHVVDLHMTFREYRRVLKPGGVALLLEITPPKSRLPQLLLKYYLKHLIPAATRLLTRNCHAQVLMAYYWETIEQCVPPETILQALGNAGFAHIDRRVSLGIFSEYTATKRPEVA